MPNPTYEEGGLALEIYSFETLPSTQRYLFEQIKEKKLKAPVALYCRRQNAGVGSRDNSWIGREGDLFLSFALEVQSLPKDLSLGSASIYFAYLMKSILSDYQKDIWIKWPNDIYSGEHKIGGVITQKHQETVICGIGVNLHNNKNSSTAFKSLKIDISIKELVEKYLYTLEQSPLWKQIFSEYQIEFEQSKRFLVHIDKSKKSLKDAHLCKDGSLLIEGKRVYSLR